MKKGHGIENETIPNSDDESPDNPLLDHAASDKNAVNQVRIKEDRSVRISAARREKERSGFNNCLLYLLAFVGLALTIFLYMQSSPRVPTPGNDKEPQNKTNTAAPYRLDLPTLYPNLTTETSPECRAAWSELAYIPCHRVLFNSSDVISRIDTPWNVREFLPLVCTGECKVALQQAYDQLSAKCSSDDRFIVDGWQGNFSTKFLKATPLESVGIILDRRNHLCRSDPEGDGSYEYCPVEMRERFWLVDDLDAHIFNNLAGFFFKTNLWRVVPEHWEPDKEDIPVGSQVQRWKVKGETYGPFAGQTSCSWCVLDYLNRTLNSWVKGEIMEAGNRRPVSLPFFIRHMRTAGQRCSPVSKWRKIFEEGVQRYEDLGLLAPGWDNPKRLGDEDRMIFNGPSKDDPPLSDIHAELQRLKGMDPQEAGSIESTMTCLNALESRYSTATCHINLSREKLISMMGKEQQAWELRRAYCHDHCSHSLSMNWPQPIVYDCNVDKVTPKTRELIQQFTAAHAQREAYCGLLNGKMDKGSTNCGQALLNMGKPSWVFDGRPDSPTLVKDVGEALEKLKNITVPEDLWRKFDDDPDVLSEDNKTYNRHNILVDSVCADCVWNWLRGFSLEERMEYIKTAESTTGYVEFVKKYHRTCTGLGATWLGEVPYGDDPVIWRVKRRGGKILRCMEAFGKAGIPSTHCVYEVTGKVERYGAEGLNRPGTKAASLWHVLQAERAVKALSAGRFDEWQSEEETHRREQDVKLWKVEERQRAAKVEYIGPVPLE